MGRVVSLFGLVVLVACGESGGTPSTDAGAPPSDGGGIVDGGPALPPGPVNVLATGPTGPIADALVVFHDASGGVIHVTKTTIEGKATSTAVVPAMVSVLVAHGLEHDILTWVDVEAGDLLVYREPGASVGAGAYDVTFSSTLPVSGGTPSFTAQTGRCTTSAAASPIRLPLAADCLQETNAVLVTARFDHAPVAFSFVKGVAPATKGKSVAANVGAWSVPSTANVTVRGAPVGRQRRLTLTQLSDGAAFGGDVMAIEENASVEFATAFADALQANLFVAGTTSGSWRGLATRATPGSVLDLEFANALPELSNPTTSGTDVRRPLFAWTGDSAAASGGIVRAAFTGPKIEEGYTWSFVIPPGRTSVMAPAMPADAERFLPKADASLGVFQKPEVGFITSARGANYAAFRRLPGVVGHFTGAYYLPSLTENGTLHLTATSRVGGF